MENVGIFYAHLVYITAIWSILRPFDIFCGNLVYFVAIWYIFCCNLVFFVAIWYIHITAIRYDIFYAHLIIQV
jgi:hypothetical protein